MIEDMSGNMSENTCMTEINRNLQYLIDTYKNEILDDVLFINTLLNSTLLSDLDEYMKPIDNLNNLSDQNDFTFIKFVITKTLQTKEEDMLELYNNKRKLINMIVNVDKGHIMFVCISNEYLYGELVLFHSNNGSKHVLVNRINGISEYIFHNVNEFNLENYIDLYYNDLYISKSQFRVSYTNINDYVQLFESMYDMLEDKYGKTEFNMNCSKFINMLEEFIMYFDEMYNLENISSELNIPILNNDNKIMDITYYDKIKRNEIHRYKMDKSNHFNKSPVWEIDIYTFK